MNKSSIAPLIKENYPEYYQWKAYPVDESIAIRSTKERWGILGNFAAVPLLVNGVTYSCSEQLFQMMKFTDEAILEKLHAAKGMPIKWIARKAECNGLRRGDWGTVIVDVMKFCLKTKYEQSEEFRTALADTAGYYIVEDQTKLQTTRGGRLRDANTWGVVRRGDLYEGSNLLGRLLMELRDNGGESWTKHWS